MVISLMTQNINLLGDLKVSVLFCVSCAASSSLRVCGGQDVKVSEMEPKLNKELLSVREDQKAIDAFRLMAEKARDRSRFAFPSHLLGVTGRVWAGGGGQQRAADRHDLHSRAARACCLAGAHAD